MGRLGGRGLSDHDDGLQDRYGATSGLEWDVEVYIGCTEINDIRRIITYYSTYVWYHGWAKQE